MKKYMLLNFYKTTLSIAPVTYGLLVTFIGVIILTATPNSFNITLPILPIIFLIYNILQIYRNSCIISYKEYNLFNSILLFYTLCFMFNLIISHVEIVDISWLYFNPDDSSDNNMENSSEGSDSSSESKESNNSQNPNDDSGNGFQDSHSSSEGSNNGGNPKPSPSGYDTEPPVSSSESEDVKRCGCHCEHDITEPCECCYHEEFTKDPESGKRYYDDPKSNECCNCGGENPSFGCNGCDCSFHTTCEAQGYNNEKVVDDHDPDKCRGCTKQRDEENKS
jgi:hypothetical protein